jgi:hypothetical protein
MLFEEEGILELEPLFIFPPPFIFPPLLLLPAFAFMAGVEVLIGVEVVLAALDVFVVPVLPALFVFSLPQPIPKAATASKVRRARVLRIEFSPVTQWVS